MDLGDTLTFSSDLYDGPFVSGSASPNLVNAATVALTITLPDGTITTPTVANPPSTTGKYVYNYVTSPTGQSGRYTGTWQFTLSNGLATSYVQSFDVGATLVTVGEALGHLRAIGVISASADLDRLQTYCFIATDAVERDLGRVLTPRTVVETHNGGVGSIVLRKAPVISVTSVTETGVALSNTFGYLLQTLADGGGVLLRGSQLVPQYFWPGRQNVTVTYTAGYTVIPWIARKVALNTIQGMWQESQQAPHPALSGDYSGLVTSAQGMLTPIEQGAYDALRLVGIG